MCVWKEGVCVCVGGGGHINVGLNWIMTFLTGKKQTHVSGEEHRLRPDICLKIKSNRIKNEEWSVVELPVLHRPCEI